MWIECTLLPIPLIKGCCCFFRGSLGFFDFNLTSGWLWMLPYWTRAFSAQRGLGFSSFSRNAFNGPAALRPSLEQRPSCSHLYRDTPWLQPQLQPSARLELHLTSSTFEFPGVEMIPALAVTSRFSLALFPPCWLQGQPAALLLCSVLILVSECWFLCARHGSHTPVCYSQALTALC